MENKKSFFYTLLVYPGKAIIRLIEAIIKKKILNIPVVNSSEFKWVSSFENNHKIILEEFIQVKRKNYFPDIAEISDEQKPVVETNKWHFFPFYIYGNKINSNLEECPETARLLKEIPLLTTAFFSVLEPGAHVKRHRGAYKGYLRFHFGVKIPDSFNQCGIRIEDKTYHWENGKSLIFDDTYLHEVWNNSALERVVLYVDFIRPMPKLLIIVSQLLTKLISVSPYVQTGLKKLRER